MNHSDSPTPKAGLRNSAPRIQATGKDNIRSKVKNPVIKTKAAHSWIFNGIITLLLMALIGLQGVGLTWLSQERAYNHMMKSQVRRIQDEITNLRNQIDANITEDRIALKIMVLNSRVTGETARQIASVIYKNAMRYNRDPDLILSIMSVESGFDPTIISSMGAIGLMQVMPQWIDVLDIRCDLKDPNCNTRYGLQILGAYEQLYGGLDLALTAYNRGPGPVDYALMKGKNPNNGYAEKIRAVYNRLRALGKRNQTLKMASSDP